MSNFIALYQTCTEVKRLITRREESQTIDISVWPLDKDGLDAALKAVRNGFKAVMIPFQGVERPTDDDVLYLLVQTNLHRAKELRGA